MVSRYNKQNKGKHNGTRQNHANAYHINKGETDNVKYVHKGLGFEIIFDKNGKRVTTPENIGTLNYGPDPKSLGHVFWDVLPYWFWGNSPQDTTPLWRRIYGTDK